jgi:hypothetical protein
MSRSITGLALVALQTISFAGTGAAAMQATSAGGVPSGLAAGSVPVRGLSKVVVPSEGFRTIQQGIDAVADRGTVLIRSGVYEETVTIAGKRVTLQGSGRSGEEQTVLIGNDPRLGTINFGAGGGGIVKSMIVTGGAYGLSSVEPSPAAVDVRDVTIERTGRGIYGSAFSSLVVRDSTIQGTSWNAISLFDFAGVAKLNDTVIGSSGHVGVYINYASSGVGATYLDDDNIQGNPGGGVVTFGTGFTDIEQTRIYANNFAGIRVMFNPLGTFVSNTEMGGTAPRPDTGLFGDGLVDLCSKVLLTGTQFPDFPLPLSNYTFDIIDLNTRAGLSNFGGDVGLGNTAFYFNAGFDLEGEPYPCGPGPAPTDFVFGNNGGIGCYDLLLNGFGPCKVESANIQPPELMGADDTP